MSKVAAAEGAVCARAACGAGLTPPLMQCARCKAVAYCSKGVKLRVKGLGCRVKGLVYRLSDVVCYLA
jgi:hypothetical protein